MIKRIVFDLDNTLINWEENYWHDAIIKTCFQLQIEYSVEMEEKIKDVIDSYEKNEQYFNVEIMQNLINKKLCVNYSTDFIKTILKFFEICVPKEMDINLIDTLEYLYKKYELVVLTNWFENQQIERLKNAKIIKFFKHVYGTENIKMKPNKEAFLKAIGKLKPAECVMIGDDLKTDIDGAINVGMNAIFLNNKNVLVDKKYTVITNISELMKIL